MTMTLDDIRGRESRHVLQTYRRQPVAFVRGNHDLVEKTIEYEEQTSAINPARELGRRCRNGVLVEWTLFVTISTSCKILRSRVGHGATANDACDFGVRRFDAAFFSSLFVSTRTL